MALYVNNKEIENVYFKGTKIERVFVNSKMVYEATIYVDKPTVTGAYTYNTAAQAPAISGYSTEAMTISGTQSATEAGTYHVYFTLNKGYAWKDGTTNVLDFTWTIDKRSIAIPTLSATSFTWLEGNTHTVTVSGIDTTYASQTGNLSQTDSSSNIGKANTVTWALKNTASCAWSDGTTGNKTASWKATWANGTSHYKTDLYNSGWDSGKLTIGPYAASAATASFESDHIAWTVASAGSGSFVYISFIYEVADAVPNGKTIHISGTGKLGIGRFYKSGSAEYTGGNYVNATNPSDLSYKSDETSSKYMYWIEGYKKSSGTITRIWLT